MKCYIDSSVVLRVLVNQPEAWRGWGKWEQAWSSALLRVETMRTIDRWRTTGELPEQDAVRLMDAVENFCDVIALVPMSDAVLKRASEPFRTVIATLDAIHLASALMLFEELSEPLHFVTHDRKLARAARAYQFPVEGV